MKISFVGTGNVAWHLAQALESAGHQIVEVYSRQRVNAKKIVSQLYDTVVVESLDFSESEADVIVLAISDDAIVEVVSQMVLPEGCVLVHTSGTKTLAELQQAVDAYSDVAVEVGVFYPLQTFTKGVLIKLNNVPFCIEATNETTEDLLIDLAQDLSGTVYVVSSDERRILHLAAVFACNFTNHLLAISQRIVEKHDLEFDLLKPLIEETIRKALASPDPATVQTGPARRHDHATIDRHLDYLNYHPEWQMLYESLSESIVKMDKTLKTSKSAKPGLS